MSPIVGIDLGTTHSLVAICDEAGPRVLLDDQGRGLLPSVVRFLPGGTTSVGWQALHDRAKFPHATISSAKRFMGRGFAECQELAGNMSTPLMEGPRGLAAFNVDGAPITPQEVSAVVLAQLRAIAQARLNTPVTRAVITVPAYFDDAQRQATRDAARLCGLTVERIVNEPTAAALAYGMGRSTQKHPGQSDPRAKNPTESGTRPNPSGTVGETVAVYDLGGGTFDISILRIESMDSTRPQDGDAFQVLSTRGDTRLGGDDFDQLISRWIQLQIQSHGGVQPGKKSATKPNHPDFSAADIATILAEATRIKHELSEHDQTEIAYHFGPGGPLRIVPVSQPGIGYAPTKQDSSHSTGRIQFTRGQFQDMIAPLVSRTLDAFSRARADAGNIQIDRVVLVGGSTRIPYVRQQVREATGLVPYTALDPDQVVALGAALQASILSGSRKDLLLLDVIPLSLGIETHGGAFAKLIVRNSAIPTRATEMFTTFKDNQTGVMIHVAQGEREMVSDCRSIARFELRGIPPMPAGIAQVEVEFLVDANGVLNVSAVERRSGRRAAIQAAPSYGLTSAEVDRMERESITHARGDMHRHRISDLTVNARLDVKWIGEALERARASIEPGYALELREMLDSLESMCAQAEADPMAADADALQGAKERLDRHSVRLHEASIAQSLREMPTASLDKPSSPGA